MSISNETLDLVKEARMKPDDALAKAWTQSGSAVSGITAYDLEAPAKKLYPVLTPIRNETPRVSAAGGIQANWRAVTGINTANMSMGLSEGQRGGVITTATADYLAVYKELGLEDFVTWKADLAAQGFDDLKALAVEGLLRSCMIGEEKIILGGLGTWALGATAKPITTAADAGGTLAKGIYVVHVVALTLDGYGRASVAGGIRQAITRTNIDGTQDVINGGSAIISPVSDDCNIGSNTGRITCTVDAKAGAVAYAWFWGIKGDDISLGAITTVNAYTITAAATGTQKIAGLNTVNDYSRDSFVFDGLLSIAARSGSGAYCVSMNNTTLTGDQTGGITQIDTALRALWDDYKLSPTAIWVSAQEQQNITAKVLLGSATASQRFTFNVQQGVIAGGTMVVSYLNKFSMDGAKEIPIRLHPNMPPGTILMTTGVLPYQLSNVTNVYQMKLRRDYFQIEWPIIKRRWEYGVYFDGVLQHYFPPSMAVISNIANG